MVLQRFKLYLTLFTISTINATCLFNFKFVNLYIVPISILKLSANAISVSSSLNVHFGHGLITFLPYSIATAPGVWEDYLQRKIYRSKVFLYLPGKCFLGQVLYRLYLCFVQVYITIVIDVLTKVEYLYISMQILTDNCYNNILICYIFTSVFLLSFGILFICRLVVVYCSIYRF